MALHKGTILFDLDGTLIDTTDLILECFQYSWSTVCGIEQRRELVLETFGIPLRDAMYRLLYCTELGDAIAGSDREDSKVQELLVAYRTFNELNHDAIARPFEGTREALIELRERGYSIGVVTSKGRELGLRGLRVCSLDDLVDSAVFLEDTTVHKPNAEPILAALKKMGASAESAAYVGDSRHDMIAARRAGVKAVGALWGPSQRAALEQEQPAFLAESITELLHIFN